jgi:hypothetical protein
VRFSKSRTSAAGGGACIMPGPVGRFLGFLGDCGVRGSRRWCMLACAGAEGPPPVMTAMMVFSFFGQSRDWCCICHRLHNASPLSCAPDILRGVRCSERGKSRRRGRLKVRRARADRPIAGPACVWGRVVRTEHVQDGVPVPGRLLAIELHKLQGKLRQAPGKERASPELNWFN